MDPRHSYSLTELFYKDFFDPPTRAPHQSAREKSKGKAKAKGPVAPAPRGKVRFHEEVKVRMIKPKGKNLPTSTLYAPDDEDDDEGWLYILHRVKQLSQLPLYTHKWYD